MEVITAKDFLQDQLLLLGEAAAWTRAISLSLAPCILLLLLRLTLNRPIHLKLELGLNEHNTVSYFTWNIFWSHDTLVPIVHDLRAPGILKLGTFITVSVSYLVKLSTWVTWIRITSPNILRQHIWSSICRLGAWVWD